VHTKGVCKLHTTCIAGTVRNACLAAGATAGAAPSRDQHEAWSDNVFAGSEERQRRGNLRRSPRLAIRRWLGRWTRIARSVACGAARRVIGCSS
jgi:hypothetical protein